MAEKIPMLIDAEVATHLEELEAPREAEQLTYDMKVTQEEMYAIADEIGQSFHYQDLIASPLFSDTDWDRDDDLYQLISDELKTTHEPANREEWRQNSEDAIRDRIKQKYLTDSIAAGTDPALSERKFEDHFVRARIETRASRGGQLSMDDIIYFWKLDHKTFKTSIFKSVADKELDKVKRMSEDADPENIAEMEEDAHAMIFGQITKVDYILKSKFEKNIRRMENFSEDDLLKVESYIKSLLPALKGVKDDKGKVIVPGIIPIVREMKRSIKSANKAKNADVARKPEENAILYGLTAEEVDEENEDIEEFMFELTGKHFKLGVEKIYDANRDAVDKDFLTAYVNYHQELRSLVALLNEGVVVETDYVRSIMERAIPFLQKNPPTVVFFHGDFGTGKTAIAIHLAETKIAPGRKPIVVSGNKFLDPDRFTEEFKVAKLKPNEFLTSMYASLGVERDINDKTPINEIISGLVGTKHELRQKLTEQYIEDYGSEEKIPAELQADINSQLDNLFTNQVQGRYVIMSMYEAMRTGVPLIIDEANAISPDVMIAFYDLLTKKIGETIRTRSADVPEFKIKEGFCIIWTGNTGERYQQARFGNKGDLDPAAYSRIHPIEVKYLPNDRTISNIQTSVAKLDLDKISAQTFADQGEMETFVKDSRNEAKNNQIYQILVTKLLNRRLGRELMVRTDDRYSIFKDLYRLAIGTRIIMDVFEERDWKDASGSSNFPNLNVGGILGNPDNFTTYNEVLVKANLSMRELMDNIVGGYLDSGCNMDIEYYLWNYVEKYSNFPEEQAVIYSILQKAQFFNTSEGWPNISNLAGADVKAVMKDTMAIDPLEMVDKYKRIRKNGEFTTLLETNGEYAYEYFSSLETLQLVFGYLPPRKVAEYQAVDQQLIESRTKNETEGVDADYARSLLRDIGQTVAMIADPAKYATSEESGLVKDEILAHPLMQALDEQRESAYSEMGEKELFEQLGDFYDLLLDISVRAGKISPDDAATAKAGNLAGKVNMVQTAWAGGGAEPKPNE